MLWGPEQAKQEIQIILAMVQTWMLAEHTAPKYSGILPEDKRRQRMTLKDARTSLP